MGKKNKIVIQKGEMVDVGRTFHTLPNLFEFHKEVERLSKSKHIDASYVKDSHGAIYKATVSMFCQGQIKDALFLLVKRTEKGQMQYQMTRIFTSDREDVGQIPDLSHLPKGIEFHPDLS